LCVTQQEWVEGEDRERRGGAQSELSPAASRWVEDFRRVFNNEPNLLLFQSLNLAKRYQKALPTNKRR
jgi:hypothetical protein